MRGPAQRGTPVAAPRTQRSHAGRHPFSSPVLALLAALAPLLLGDVSGGVSGDVLADARADWEAGRRRAAIERLEAAVAAPPAGTGPAEVAAWRGELAAQCFAVHRYRAALDAAAPLGPEWDRLRGDALYLLGELEPALALLDPASPAQCLLRVDALEALGRLDEADAELARAADVVGADDVRLLAFRGRAAARRGEHAEAAAAFRAALAGDPLDLPSMYGLGRALVATGEREEGLALLARHRELVPLVDRLEFARQGLDLEPLHAPNHAAVGDALRALGRTDGALAAYRTADRLAAPEQRAPIALRLARCLEEDFADRPAAVEALAAAFEAVGDVRLAVRAGDVELRAGRAAEAAAWFRRAAALLPDDPEIAARLAAAEAAR